VCAVYGVTPPDERGDGRERAQEAICHVKLLDPVVLDAVVQNNGSVCAMTIREPSRSSGNC